MATVESELWNIFTFYTLHGNPLDPEHLERMQLVKLARGCQMLEGGMYEASITEAEINLVYTAEVRKKNKRNTGGRMLVEKLDYNEFLNCLMKIANKLYPSSPSVDEALQQLLMENVLPLASRRSPHSVREQLADADVISLKRYYRDALTQVFHFYASETEQRRSAGVRMASGRTFEESANRNQRVMKASASGRQSRVANQMKESMGYTEFLKFGHDFGLTSSVILSTLDIGDIYLTAIAMAANEYGEPHPSAAGTGMRKCTFDEFWEILCRCSLTAYRNVTTATVGDKIRGLLLYMWRSIQASVPKAVNDTSSSSQSTYKGDLLRGAQLLNERFIRQWQKDDYKDYLAPPAPEPQEARDVLTRLLFNEELKVGDEPAAAAENTAAGDVEISLGDVNQLELGIDPQALQELLERNPEMRQMLLKEIGNQGLGDVSASGEGVGGR